MAMLRDNWLVIAISVAVIAALALLIWLWWWVPKWQMRSVTAADPKGRADIEDNIRKNVGQALGGAGVAYLQFTQQQQAAHDLLISNQVSKGFEQLGNDNLAVRLGGIYALEGVMQGSNQYYLPVLEALCAFVRESTKKSTIFPTDDVQAVLTVIGRRRHGGEVRLYRAELSKIDLTGADMRGANLFRADLEYANLGEAKLIGAQMMGANLTGAYLVGTDLANALLSGTTSGYGQREEIVSADLTGANLSGANLIGAELGGQKQLDQACGIGAKLPPGLTLKKLCPPRPVAPPLDQDVRP
jgi:uncharacterized protein YjbI with pentapeptide repeats